MGIKRSLVQWQKVLYEQQGYPDNYVDDSFLEEMKRNGSVVDVFKYAKYFIVNTKVYSLPTLVYESGMVSQQLSSISIFGSLFVYMDSFMVSPSSVLCTVLLLTLVGYLLILLSNDAEMTRLSSGTSKPDLKSVILVFGFVFGLSPLLKTLTKTISTDTIYAMTVCMLTMNLLLHDYVSEAAISSRSLSLNASVFASVCLASRLPTSWQAFVTIISAMQIFAVMPQIRAIIKDHHRYAFVILTCLMACFALIMVYVISWAVFLALAVFQLSIIFIFPCWMVRMQNLKNNIHGPWDEAMIKE